MKKRKHNTDSRGSVLIMTLIITSGMLMIGLEFSAFVANAIRASRNSDRALVSRYAAESALESGMYELRKAGSTTLINGTGTVQTSSIGATQWTYKNDANQLDPAKFDTSIKAFYKALAVKDSVTQFGLYTATDTGTEAIPGLKTMEISWDGVSACASDGQSPGIEVSMLAWTGGASVNWASADMQKVFIQDVDPTKKTATIDFSTIPDTQNQGSTKPLVVRVKPYFCDLSGVRISLADANNAVVPIPNYYLLNPLGTTGPVQQSLQAIIPAQGSISDIFDFALFSDEQINKTQ